MGPSYRKCPAASIRRLGLKQQDTTRSDTKRHEMKKIFFRDSGRRQKARSVGELDRAIRRETSRFRDVDFGLLDDA